MQIVQSYVDKMKLESDAAIEHENFTHLDILHHFSPNLANHCQTNKIPSLTEQPVLTLVRENYTDLILCMNENLEMVDSIDIVYDKNFADADMERGLVDVARDTYGRELEEFLSDWLWEKIEE